ncbi:hypothetical protein F5972_10155 [Microbispora cellulosiformans]|uniref:DUF4232 domain-containing protein n=1 Tax=Microbispora cellulosiformans TaxID=2614688 RepID=A0A5J5K955_9ACTN|nr:hypothetical protein [Microbispora cellulosiformans]KAA9379973.1 hypothetical protein F5972_10155 [Microbispora cellulosiformans]
MERTRAWGAITALFTLAACGGQATESPTPPPGVSVSLNQWRSDEAAHELEVSVRNDGDTPVRFVDVQLVTGSFATLPPTRVDSTLGRTPRTDLRIPYGEARCDPATIPPVRPATVVATVQAGEGPARRAEFPVRHPDPLLAGLVKAECGAYLLRRAADVTFGDTWTRAGRTLRGVLLVTRRQGAEPVTIDELGATTHYAVRPLSGRSRPVAVLEPGTPRLEIPVEVTPARCDWHAFAEAKKAYLFPVYGTVGTGERRYLIATPPAPVQQTFLSYAKDVCGVGG